MPVVLFIFSKIRNFPKIKFRFTKEKSAKKMNLVWQYP